MSMPGAGPDRVLLVGSGPAAGVGVETHSLALTGALARRLSATTGRGAVVESRAVAHSGLDTIAELLAVDPAGSFDAVIITAGLMEAIDLLPDIVWRRWLLAVIEMVQARFGAETTVVVAGMPAPTSAILAGVGWRGGFIDRRASRLNRTSVDVVSSDERWHFVQLPASEHVNGQPTADSYAGWADRVCMTLAPELARARS